MRKPRNQMNRQLFLMYGIGLLLVIYLAIVYAPYLHGTAADWLFNLRAMEKADYFHFTIDAHTLKVAGFSVLIYLLIILVYHSTRRNYRYGEEHGSAKWGDPHKICRKYRAERKSGENRINMQNQKAPEIYHPNLILTQNMRLGLDTHEHRRNLNVLVIGGSGAGKSMFYARPNLLQANTDYIVLDPKGELLEDCGGFLEKEGYKVWVLNLLHPEQSDHYNPFPFLEIEDDVLELVENIFDNTTDIEARKGEQIWDDSAKSLLRSLIFYVKSVKPPEEQNFTSVMRLLRRAETKEDERGNPVPSELDQDMQMLGLQEQKNGRNPDAHPAYRFYKEYRSGAVRTMQSVLFTLNARLTKFNLQSIADLTATNDLDLKRMGKEKIALFCVIPDQTKAYNFLVGMLYTQLFQQLYRTADDFPGKRLPVPVHFLMDEFANVALPKDFESLLSTMRQRQIFCSIILQNLSQLKAMYEKQWESIAGNCDSFLYLGGNEQSTFEYVSKRLGKETIDFKSFGKSKGKMGNYSTNYQLTGRELLTPDEVGRLDNQYAIYIMRGEYPILDLKYDLMHHPNIDRIAKGGAPPYVHTVRKQEIATAKQQEEQKQLRRERQQQTASALDAFFIAHTMENGDIVFDIDELKLSEEALREYAANLTNRKEEKS